MTEPEVASSDATNIQTRIEREGDDYVINGRKWWIVAAPAIRAARSTSSWARPIPTAPRHSQQSMILVPADTPGITHPAPAHRVRLRRRAARPHGDRRSRTCACRRRNILLGEGRGFEIAQGRLGPGRIHHCMRLIGLAERALEKMCKRAIARVAFGTTVAEQGVTHERIAEARIMIDMARLLMLNAAWMMDIAGNKARARPRSR